MMVSPTHSNTVSRTATTTAVPAHVAMKLTHCCSCTVQSAARAASSNVLYTPTYITWSPEEQRKGGEGGLAFELPPVLLPSTVGVALTILGPYLPPLASTVHETVPVFQVRSFLGGACFVGASALVHRRGCSFSFGGVVGVGGRGGGGERRRR